MKKNEFNNLSVLKQLNYVNGELKKGNSLRTISSNLELSKTTIRERFSKINYVFNAKQHQYAKTTEVKHNLNLKDKKLQTTEKQHNVNINTLSNDDIVSLKELLLIKNNLISLVEDVKHKENIIKLSEIKIDFKKLKGNVKTRSFNLYEDVLKEFSDFCKNNKQYTQKDLLSMAILEYINKYKK